MRDLFAAAVAGIVAIYGFIGLIAIPIYFGEVAACSNIKRMTGAETDVTFSLGCMVKYRGEWVEREVMTRKKQDITVK